MADTQTQTQTQNPSHNPHHNADVKEISPNLGRRKFQGNLVETMDFLFVKLVKAKKLPQQNVYVEVVVGDFKAMSECSKNKPKPIWN
ncbi:hypothetical protein Vadar_008584 [Vaccinium darrowii]|uniref:Uncharacterized protein n=1 Tax=Vaccinium darrowii TaxID=229202 RepID=A0ACB7YCV9_9ERIC|nr:hypothetical protein Vadar_008584 [Vaccinium darrowii]